MTPPQVHINLQELFSAGLLPIITVGEPGVHGAVVTGIQGWGVSTPNAADVAAATCGLLKVVHMPKGITFFMGMLSMIVAAGTLLVVTRFSGVMTKALGATPKLQVACAPLQTNCPICHLMIRNRCSVIRIQFCPDYGLRITDYG